MEHTEETWEQEIKKLLKEDPQAAIVLAVEHYTGLIWTVSSRYLANPEDRKECVNDTFAEFYWQREKFDGTKGSMAAFLCGIARHQAISHYRKNKRHETDRLPEELQGQGADLDWADDRLDLEQALDALKAEDAEIIRMKYYGGMTVQEIADSLNLPYETVKKRHQRSLGKMRLWLLAALVLLLAGLAACAYVVLQHFGVIPRYGINRSEEMAFYLLADTPEYEDEHLFIKLESGVLSEDSLILTLYVEFRELRRRADDQTNIDMEEILEERSKSLDHSDLALILEDGTVYTDLRMTSSSPPEEDRQDWSREYLELIFEPLAELPEEETIPMGLRISGMEFPFTFQKAKEEELEDYSYVLDSQGGVLAIPKLQEGRLYVDIYPLNCGDYTTDPGLVRSVCEGIGGSKGEVTVTGEDGTVRVGECLSYSPFSSKAFYRWDFGPAEAGEYRLDIPFVYQTAEISEDFLLTVSDKDPGIGQSFQVPGSRLTVSSYSKEQPEGTEFSTAGDQENGELRRFLCFDVETEALDRILTGITFAFDVETENDGLHLFFHSWLLKQEESYENYVGFSAQLPEGYEAGPMEIRRNEQNPIVFYRWNHPFSIPIQASAEE